MRVLAMYLPQFHRTKENDEWWGTGFTEWTAVKNAEKLYDDHDQPRVPSNQNYYDLLEKETMQWQASLMKKYKIDGMCMYHYWFKDGRRILEKPAENLLRWTEIEMPYCFCWANETWARTWSKLQGTNAWSDVYEGEKNCAASGILLEQAYGMEEQWKEHFDYVRPFFEDERYIKVDGKPLFVIYKAADVPCLPEMLDYWEELAAGCGLEGIYVIGSACNKAARECVNAMLEHQPGTAMGKVPQSYRYQKNDVKILEYNDVWEGLLKLETGDNTYFEGFVGFDDTPRRGKRGTVTAHATPEKFSDYLTELLAKSAAHDKEIVFLNAWNEWGEGMYLEPDEQHGEEYLKAIPYAKENYKFRISKYMTENVQSEISVEEDLERDRHYLHLLDEWMTLRQNGFWISDWLEQKGYKRIAVYGYGICGKHLCRELSDNGIQIAYIVDRNAAGLNTACRTYLPSDQLPEVDLMIVSATYEYGNIYKNMVNKGMGKVISLQSILHDKRFSYGC